MEIKKLPGSVPWLAQDPRTRQACLARPGGLCPSRAPSGLRFSSVYLSCKINFLYILPELVNHRITERNIYSLFLLFLVRFVKLGIMSSCSSNHMEEDAWLMKIETKREELMDAVKGGKGKEATVNPSPVTAQALLAEEEEEASSPPKDN